MLVFSLHCFLAIFMSIVAAATLASSYDNGTPRDSSQSALFIFYRSWPMTVAPRFLGN